MVTRHVFAAPGHPETWAIRVDADQASVLVFDARLTVDHRVSVARLAELHRAIGDVLADTVAEQETVVPEPTGVPS